VNEALRIILPIYLLIFFLVAFLGRSYLVWKMTGINPYSVGRTDRPIDFVEGFYAVPVILLLVTTLVFSFFPSAYIFATPIIWLENRIVQIIGLVLMVLGLIWIAMAQSHMGKSWRIGIDAKNRTELVETGLFAVSRNPIFLGVRTALFGFFLALPSAFTLVAVVLADVLIQIQVRLEEEFLASVHGEKYAEFRGRVRRWI
jgi:protein-S-isoprenylcysteine O-methyltransferase Ste14